MNRVQRYAGHIAPTAQSNPSDELIAALAALALASTDVRCTIPLKDDPPVSVVTFVCATILLEELKRKRPTAAQALILKCHGLGHKIPSPWPCQEAPAKTLARLGLLSPDGAIDPKLARIVREIASIPQTEQNTLAHIARLFLKRPLPGIEALILKILFV